MTNEDEIHETEELLAIDRVNGLNRIKHDLRIDVQKLVMFDELVTELDLLVVLCGHVAPNNARIAKNVLIRAAALQRGELP